MEAIIYAGNTVKFDKAFADYKASDGYSLEYSLVNNSVKYTFTATADGDDFAVNVSASTTATWQPGDYKYFAFIKNGTERFLVEQGSVTIKPDPASTVFDSRSHVKKMLDAIESVIEGRATEDISTYTINGRQIVKMTLEELLKARSLYRREYERERAFKSSSRVIFTI